MEDCPCTNHLVLSFCFSLVFSIPHRYVLACAKRSNRDHIRSSVSNWIRGDVTVAAADLAIRCVAVGRSIRWHPSPRDRPLCLQQINVFTEQVARNGTSRKLFRKIRKKNCLGKIRFTRKSNKSNRRIICLLYALEKKYACICSRASVFFLTSTFESEKPSDYCSLLRHYKRNY